MTKGGQLDKTARNCLVEARGDLQAILQGLQKASQEGSKSKAGQICEVLKRTLGRGCKDEPDHDVLLSLFTTLPGLSSQVVAKTPAECT